MNPNQSKAAVADAALVEAVREGDRSAFATLVDRHAGRLRSVLLRLTSDPDQADELAQETLVRAYRGLDGFRGEAKFGTWLIQIGIHLLRDGARRSRRHPMLSIDELQASASQPIAASPWSNPSDAVEEDQIRLRLLTLLRELPEPYREVFVLHHVHDMPYEEISRVTGATVGSLKVRAHRARKLLKDRLFDSETGDRSPRKEVSP